MLTAINMKGKWAKIRRKRIENSVDLTSAYLDFQQRNIQMELCTKIHTSLKEAALQHFIDLLREDGRAHICIFVNFCAEVGKISGPLEDVMAEALLRAGVLTINGAMDKNENKIAFLRFLPQCFELRVTYLCSGCNR